jgi:hypothetical protein
VAVIAARLESDIEPAFASIVKRNATGLVVGDDPFLLGRSDCATGGAS